MFNSSIPEDENHSHEAIGPSHGRPRDWDAIFESNDALERIDPDGLLSDEEAIAAVKAEIDRTKKVQQSKRKQDAFCSELEAGMFANAAELGLRNPLTGHVDSQQIREQVVTFVTSDDNRTQVMSQVVREARANVEDAAAFRPPTRNFSNLAEALQADLGPTRWAIEGMLTANGNVNIAAQYKSGKTTLMFNLIRAYCDNLPFLGHDVRPLEPGKTVAFWDFELDENYALDQLKKLGIEHPERCVHLASRGYTMPITTDLAKEWAIKELRDSNAEVWIIDPFAAMYTGDENSNQEVGAFLRALDEIKVEAGVKELYLVSHTGRTEGSTRSRGATRLDDWPDARWTWEKKSGTEDRKRLVAHGRSVDTSIICEYDIETNGYSVVDISHEVQAQKESKDTDRTKEVLNFIDSHPDCSISQIRDAVSGRNEFISESVQSLIDGREVQCLKVGKSNLYSVIPLINHA